MFSAELIAMSPRLVLVCSPPRPLVTPLSALPPLSALAAWSEQDQPLGPITQSGNQVTICGSSVISAIQTTRQPKKGRAARAIT